MKIEKYNQNNKRKYTLITLGLLSVIGISLVIGSSFAKFSENQSFKIVEGNIDYYGDADVIFSYYDQNSEELETMPTKESNLVFDYGSCDNNEEITWDNESWGPVISNITNSKTRCNLYFKESGSTLRPISSLEKNGMWGYKDKLTKLVLENSLTPKMGAVVYGPFDESSEKNNGIQSYVVCEEGDTNCIGYLQGNEKITLNKDSSYLFRNFSKVTTIEGIENLDTSSVTNMNHMFCGMYTLQSLNLSTKFDTSNVEDMSWMFQGMESLQSLNLGEKFDTSKVINMSDMFSSMYKLQELNLGDNFDTSNVTNMEGMFCIMKSLQNLDLSTCNFNTSNVENMSQMFWEMSSLQELNLGEKFDTFSVTDMNMMFDDMNSLSELNLGEKFNTSNVENMSNMFYRMSKLQSLDLSKYNFYTNKVTDMSYMFSEMYALKNLDLGDKFDTSKVTKMNNMFFKMSVLENLDLSTSNFNTINVENMELMFGGDINLTTINYGSSFIHKEGANTKAMFGGKTYSAGISYADCPANKPNTDTHPSWTGVSFAGVE